MTPSPPAAGSCHASRQSPRSARRIGLALATSHQAASYARADSSHWSQIKRRVQRGLHYITATVGWGRCTARTARSAASIRSRREACTSLGTRTTAAWLSHPRRRARRRRRRRHRHRRRHRRTRRRSNTAARSASATPTWAATGARTTRACRYMKEKATLTQTWRVSTQTRRVACTRSRTMVGASPARWFKKKNAAFRQCNSSPSAV